MKKLSILLMFLLCMPLLMAQNIDKVFNTLKDESNCTFQHIDSNTLQSMNGDLKSLLVDEFKIDEAKVLLFNSEDPKAIMNYNKHTGSLKKSKGFETLVQVDKDENKVLILGNLNDNNVIKEMLVFIENHSNKRIFVWVKGNMDLAKIDKMVQVNY